MPVVVSYVGNFSVCGIDRTIEILEADMDILKNTSEGLLWPKYLPKLDGAMIWCVVFPRCRTTAAVLAADHLRALCQPALVCSYKQGDPRALEDLTMLLRAFTTGSLAPHVDYQC